MTPLSASELHRWLSDPERPRPQLLDVRQPRELAISALEGSLAIPLGTLAQRLGEVDRQRPVVCICHHGVRSMHAALLLEREGFPEVFNLSGGIDAWAHEVDPEMKRY